MPTYLEYATQGLAALWSLSMIALSLRVGWLHGEGRAPRAPPTGRLLLGAIWGFLLSDQYKLIGDALTSLLVLASRVLIVSVVATIVISLVALTYGAPPKQREHIAPATALSLPFHPGIFGTGASDDATARNRLVFDALSAGDIQAIIAHSAPEERSPAAAAALLRASKLIPPGGLTSTMTHQAFRTTDGGVVTVYLSEEYFFPDSKALILDTTFRYDERPAPELIAVSLQPDR
jgi:hypothetical protein